MGGEELGSKHKIEPGCIVENEEADAGRDGRTSRETKFSGANGDRKKWHFVFPPFSKLLSQLRD